MVVGRTIPPGYVSTQNAAARLGVTARTVTRACRALVDGERPFGCAFNVIVVRGVGGKAGRQYAIRENSLPALASGCEAPTAAPGFDMAKAVAAQTKKRAEIERKLKILRPVLKETRDTPAFTAALGAVSVAHAITVRTLTAWLKKLDAHGEGSLARTSHPGRTTEVSRVFDRAWLAAGGTHDALRAIAEELACDIRGLWADDSGTVGATRVAFLAATTLHRLAAHHGHPLAIEVCRIGSRLVGECRDARQLHVRVNDAEAHRNSMPRITRSYKTCRPMDVVFLDVRYSPFQIPRGDKYVYPAQIAFLDMATGRMHQTLVPLARSERVSGAHVFAAFCSMILNEEWGLPRLLYRDGGSENSLTSRIAAACASSSDPRYNTITVRPYSPQSKPIEGMFAVYDRQCFGAIRGFPGFKSQPLRKTALSDRKTVSYARSWENFVSEVDLADRLFTGFKPKGGVSRQDRYDAFVAKGHKPRLGDSVIMALGGELAKRRNRHGSIRSHGEAFTADALYGVDPAASVSIAHDPTGQFAPAMLQGSKVIPLRRDLPFPQSTGIERRRALDESDRRKRVREEMLDALQPKLATYLSLRERLRAASENGSIKLGSSGIVDGSRTDGPQLVVSTAAQQIATLRLRQAARKAQR